MGPTMLFERLSNVCRHLTRHFEAAFAISLPWQGRPSVTASLRLVEIAFFEGFEKHREPLPVEGRNAGSVSEGQR